MSSKKAIGFDSISDTWIKITGCTFLLKDLWNNNNLQLLKSSFRTDLIPLNKVWPNIPKNDEFRPIVV